MIVRPTMTYTATVWAYAVTTRMRMFYVVQNKAPILVFDTPWYVRNSRLHEDAGLAPIPAFFRSPQCESMTHLRVMLISSLVRWETMTRPIAIVINVLE